MQFLWVFMFTVILCCAPVPLDWDITPVHKKINTESRADTTHPVITWPFKHSDFMSWSDFWLRVAQGRGETMLLQPAWAVTVARNHWIVSPILQKCSRNKGVWSRRRDELAAGKLLHKLAGQHYKKNKTNKLQCKLCVKVIKNCAVIWKHCVHCVCVWLSTSHGLVKPSSQVVLWI